jgi:hypothetical protein
MSLLNNSFYINRSKVNLNITKSIAEESKSNPSDQETFTKSFNSEFISPSNKKNSLLPDPNILTCSLSDSKNEIKIMSLQGAGFRTPSKLPLEIPIINSPLKSKPLDLTCPVCFCTYSDMAELHEFNCKHYFCNTCIKEFLTLLINENQVDKIKCLDHNCPGRIQELELEIFLDENLISKYSKFSKRNLKITLCEHDRMFQCPYPDCEELVDIVENEKIEHFNDLRYVPSTSTVMQRVMTTEETYFLKNEVETNSNYPGNRYILEIKEQLKNDNFKNNENVQNFDTPSSMVDVKIFLVCNKGHKFCKNCKCLYWHYNEPCKPQDTDLDNNLLKFYENNKQDMKNCPKCNIWTEKNLGCNHIKCSNCQTHWCWICSGPFTNDHFSSPSSPCVGKMYEGVNVNFLNNNHLNMNLNVENDNFVIELRNLLRERIQMQEQLGNNWNPNVREVEDYEYELVFFKWPSNSTHFNNFNTEKCNIFIKFYENIFLRIFYALLVLLICLITNYSLFKICHSYLERKLDIFNFSRNRNLGRHFSRRLSVDRFNEIVSFFIQLNVFFCSYFYGFLLTPIFMIYPLIKYVCHKRNHIET